MERSGSALILLATRYPMFMGVPEGTPMKAIDGYPVLRRRLVVALSDKALLLWKLDVDGLRRHL